MTKWNGEGQERLRSNMGWRGGRVLKSVGFCYCFSLCFRLASVWPAQLFLLQSVRVVRSHASAQIQQRNCRVIILRIAYAG